MPSASWWQLSFKSDDEATDRKAKQQGSSPLGYMVDKALGLLKEFTPFLTTSDCYPPATFTNHALLESGAERALLPSWWLH